MGTVYEATQDSPQRPVALKVLPTELARDPKVAERFAREANRLAALEEHPGIAKVYASGEEAGVAYLAMQLLTGGDLEARLQSHGHLPWQEAATVGAAVADALHFAHEQGIVHRDVKPANIMFTGQGQPVVTDFGIAQAADEVRMTMTGTSICTP
ncbi:MAG: serine/threonine-protein kinase, partial [Armatimonadia bacterium]